MHRKNYEYQKRIKFLNRMLKYSSSWYPSICSHRSERTWNQLRKESRLCNHCSLLRWQSRLGLDQTPLTAPRPARCRRSNTPSSQTPTSHCTSAPRSSWDQTEGGPRWWRNRHFSLLLWIDQCKSWLWSARSRTDLELNTNQWIHTIWNSHCYQPISPWDCSFRLSPRITTNRMNVMS